MSLIFVEREIEELSEGMRRVVSSKQGESHMQRHRCESKALRCKEQTMPYV
jgi:hypothetical protein